VGKGDQHAGPPRTIPISAISFLQTAVLFAITSNIKHLTSNIARVRGFLILPS